MKIEQEHIDQIRASFGKMQSREDLLHLLNKVKPLVYGTNSVPFELKQITWYSNPKLAQKRYSEFKIKKKSGMDRCINAPVAGLKSIQKTLSFILQCVFEPHPAAMGFVRGKSIVDNAKIHVGSRYVYNIDLKDFFQSVDQARVWKCLQLNPFNLVDNNDIFDLQVIESATIRPLSLSGNFENRSIKNLVIKLNYNGYRFLTGSWNLKLKAGGNIFYRIENNNTVDSSGIITIFNITSSFENIVEIAKSEAQEKELDPELVLDLILGKLITIHQKKISEKNTRLRLANIIASLCCTEMEVERKNLSGEWEKVKRNVVPQGAPTSPVITNVVCQRLDLILTGVAKRFGLKYSRYADDLTFSSVHNVYQPEGEFLKELHRIIEEQGFFIKDSKTRLQKDGYRKEVTGLLVNEKANVQHRYIKQLRMWLHRWETFGYERASLYFFKDYNNTNLKNGLPREGNKRVDRWNVKEFIFSNSKIGKRSPTMTDVISGKLDYLKMVKGSNNDLYVKLRNRFDLLTGKPISPIHSSTGETQGAVLDEFQSINYVIPSSYISKAFSKGSKTNVSTIPIRHNPNELVNLLKNFSLNNSPLKYTTHSWDSGRDANMFKDIEEFLELAKLQYNKFSFDLNKLNRNLHGKINNFLFNKDISVEGWGDINPSKRIRFGWSSPELIEACKSNPSLNPEDYILPVDYQLQKGGKTLQKFKHIIDVFKNEIEIRDENSSILNLILEKHGKYLFDFADPIIINLENKTFYTDVQWLSKSLDLIFEGIQKRPNHRVVEYFVDDQINNRIVLNILHKESFNNGMSIHDDKLSLKAGDFSSIKDYLINLCDWSIESQFAEGCYRINYLSSNEEETAYEKIETAIGFKHVLTFYK